MTSRFPSEDSRDELHDENEIVVRPIVKVDGQTIVFLVERELEIALGATGADVLLGFEEAYLSIPCGVFTCHMCMMSHLGGGIQEIPFENLGYFPIVSFS